MLTRDPNYNDPSSRTGRRFSEYRKRVDRLDVVHVIPRIPFSLFALKRGSYDLITSPDPFETGLVAYLISRKLGASLELQVHTDLWSPYFASESFKNRVRRLIAEKLLPRATCVRVVSLRIKEGIERWLTPRVSVSVLPVHPDLVYPERTTTLKDKYPQFSFVGLMLSRLTREKNIPFALRAFKRVVDRFPKAGLVIVGSGPEERALKSAIDSLGLRENVIFEPWIHNPALYFASADLFILSSDYEGYGLTLLEAAAAGCPILTTEVGCVGDVLPQGAVHAVSPRDEGSFAELLLSLVSSSELRESKVEAARQAISGLGSFDDFADKMAAAWRACAF